jgi:VWFA-related protein
MLRSRLAVASMLLTLPFLSTAEAATSPNSQHDGKKSNATSQEIVLRLDVRRVPLDVVVTDKNGNTVRGLKKEDFAVKEDKKNQRVLTFGYMDGSVPSFTPPKLTPLPTNAFVNVPSEVERGPLYLLYYDMVNSSTDDQMSAHHQLLDFLDSAPSGTRFALFVNASGLHLIQGFTSDHALLRSAILDKGVGPHVPNVFLYGRNYGFEDVGAVLSNLKFLAEYMSGIPGRKNLLWLSSEFPIPVGPIISGRNANAGSIGGGFSNSTMQINDLTYLEREGIKETYSAMMRSEVALYPVDLNGVKAGGDVLADYEHEDDIAAATGGHAYYANNRVTELIDKAVENGMSYYSLSYSSTNTKYDGQERQIEVTLAKKTGYTLNYRRLYYGVSDEDAQAEHKPGTLQARFIAAKTSDTLYTNIEHGAPMLHDLLFSAHLTAAGAPMLATAEQMEQLQDSPVYFKTRKKNQTPKPVRPVKLQKYVIDYGVFDPRLKPMAARKEKSGTLEFAAAAYDADGRLLNSMLNEGLASSDTESGGKSGSMFHAVQELEVPPGATWIRLAVRDKLDNRTGTLEVRLPLKPESISAAASRTN